MNETPYPPPGALTKSSLNLNLSLNFCAPRVGSLARILYAVGVV